MQEQSDALGGSSWRAVGIVDATGAIVSDAHTSRVTAQFAEVGEVSGVGGCNRYAGTWAATDGALDLGPVRRTLMACDALATEQAYFAALERVSAYVVDGDELRLTDADGVDLVVFARDGQAVPGLA